MKRELTLEEAVTARAKMSKREDAASQGMLDQFIEKSEKHAVLLAALHSLEHKAIDAASPLAAGDVQGTIARHRAYLDEIRSADATEIETTLTQRILKRTPAKTDARSFLEEWVYTLLCAAGGAKPVLNKDEGDGYSSRVSILQLHDIECLLPMATFLEKMHTPVQDAAERSRKGSRAFELILDFMDHIWGFAALHVDRSKLKFRTLAGVIAAMERA